MAAASQKQLSYSKPSGTFDYRPYATKGKIKYKGKVYAPNKPVVFRQGNDGDKYGYVMAVVGHEARLLRFGSFRHRQNQNYAQWKRYWSRFNGLRLRLLHRYGPYISLRRYIGQTWCYGRPTIGKKNGKTTLFLTNP